MLTVELRPTVEADLAMYRRFAVEPGLIGRDWFGYRDAQGPARRFAVDGYLGAEDGRLIVQSGDDATGFVTWSSVLYGGTAKHWEIGIALLPEFRGKGIGWRAQAMLCEYLFEHSPVVRIAAGTQPENIAEQKALEKAGFHREGVVRSCEFREGAWRDGLLYSRLRSDPAPTLA